MFKTFVYIFDIDIFGKLCDWYWTIHAKIANIFPNNFTLSVMFQIDTLGFQSGLESNTPYIIELYSIQIYQFSTSIEHPR